MGTIIYILIKLGTRVCTLEDGFCSCSWVRPADSSRVFGCSHCFWTQPTNLSPCQTDASLLGYDSPWRPVFLPQRKYQHGHKVELSLSSQEYSREQWRCGEWVWRTISMPSTQISQFCFLFSFLSFKRSLHSSWEYLFEFIFDSFRVPWI